MFLFLKIPLRFILLIVLSPLNGFPYYDVFLCSITTLKDAILLILTIVANAIFNIFVTFNNWQFTDRSLQLNTILNNDELKWVEGIEPNCQVDQ